MTVSHSAGPEGATLLNWLRSELLVQMWVSWIAKSLGWCEGLVQKEREVSILSAAMFYSLPPGYLQTFDVADLSFLNIYISFIVSPGFNQHPQKQVLSPEAGSHHGALHHPCAVCRMSAAFLINGNSENKLLLPGSCGFF